MTVVSVRSTLNNVPVSIAVGFTGAQVDVVAAQKTWKSVEKLPKYKHLPKNGPSQGL